MPGDILSLLEYEIIEGKRTEGLSKLMRERGEEIAQHVNATIEFQQKLLIAAVGFFEEDIDNSFAVYLLKKGADINIVDDFGATPLMKAAWCGHSTMVRYLIKNGADIDAGYWEKGIDEMYRVVLKSLKKAGEDISVASDAELVALTIAACAKNPSLLESLIAQGVCARVASNSKVLLAAARNGQKELVASLVASGADITAVDENGCTALMDAARNGQPEIVSYLLKNGVAIHVRDNGDWTALHHASVNEHGDAIECLAEAAVGLIEAGVDLVGVVVPANA